MWNGVGQTPCGRLLEDVRVALRGSGWRALGVSALAAFRVGGEAVGDFLLDLLFVPVRVLLAECPREHQPGGVPHPEGDGEAFAWALALQDFGGFGVEQFDNRASDFHRVKSAEGSWMAASLLNRVTLPNDGDSAAPSQAE